MEGKKEIQTAWAAEKKGIASKKREGGTQGR